MNPNPSPIQYVLEQIHADLVMGKHEDPIDVLRRLVNERMYAEALVLAIALEVERTKQQHARDLENGLKEIYTILNPTDIMEELSARQLWGILLTLSTDHRALLKRTPPPANLPPPRKPPPRRPNP